MTLIFSFYSIMAMLIAAFIIPLIGLKDKAIIPYIAITATFISMVLAALTIPAVQDSLVLTQQMEEWAAPFGISLTVDGFSLMLIFMITLIGFLVTVFSLKFIKENMTKYYALICLLMVGLLGIAHTGDMFNLFVFLEITSISSYILVSYNSDEKALGGALKYIIIGSFATSMVLLGVTFLYGITGTLNMADLSMALRHVSGPVIPISLGLLIAGIGVKAAIFPFHAWKPDAISAMPAPAGAMLSGLSTAVGLYAIFRIAHTVFAGSIGTLYIALIALGAATMIFGALLALQQKNILRLLAFSTISQVGFILLAFGIGFFNPLGTDAAILHLFNVIVIEALLFLVAGVLMMYTGTQDMEKMGMKSNVSPILSYAFLIGILANIGIPLFSGFVSKWMIYIVTFQTFPILTVLAAVTSAISLAYGFRAFSLIFMGNRKSVPKLRLSKTMIIPIIILCAIIILFGVLPQLGIDMAGFASKSMDTGLYLKAVLGG